MTKKRRQKIPRYRKPQAVIARSISNSSDAAQPKKAGEDGPLAPGEIGREVLARLNDHLQQAEASSTAPDAHQPLDEMGLLLRQWRLRQGHTRQMLAQRLHWESELVLCLEHGLALPTDLTPAHLAALTTLLGEDDLDRRLRARIESYVVSRLP
jgi:hypothetical protein